MPKINQEEYEVLKGLDDKWKWIAVNGKGWLLGFTSMPDKKKGRWSNEEQQMGFFNDKVNGLDRELFRFIQSSDPEPYSVRELIEEYEQWQNTTDYLAEGLIRLSNSMDDATKRMKSLFRNKLVKLNESEETEVKSKQELIDKWESAIGAAEFYGKGKEERLISYMKDFVRDLNQLDEPVLTDDLLEDAQEVLLQTKVFQHEGNWYKVIKATDEPEVLSQEWIDRHTYYEDEYDFYYADPDELKNLLVPKQVELEAKIQELIETYKQEEGAYSNPENGWIGGFIEDLKNLVEEEQKYRVLDGNTTLLGRINGLMLTTVEILEYYPEYAPTFDFTEQEIKDYDERYWPFAVKVEELEE